MSFPADPGHSLDPQREARRSRWRAAVRDILFGNVIIVVVALALALLIGSILIAATNDAVLAAAGSGDLGALAVSIWDAVSGAYVALFQGAFYDFRRPTFALGIVPLTETLVFATPLIIAGLGLGLTFRAGLFNIGGRGQMLFGATVGGWIGLAWPLPGFVHPLIAIVLGVVAGAAWGALAGVLKAFTGAHEVIVTIMLNYIGYYIVFWLLSTQGLLQAPGSINAKSLPMLHSAVLPRIFGPEYRVHVGFILALVAVVGVWWLLERSSLGFRMRAVGENPDAARTAGIDVKATIVIAMAISGGLVGLAGVNQVLGTETSGVTAGVDAGIGFSAITVALLGRSNPWGVLAAGLLFGAFKAGGFTMQASQGIPIDIITIVQSLIVLFIAAPPLIRMIFRIPDPRVRRVDKEKKAVKA